LLRWLTALCDLGLLALGWGIIRQLREFLRSLRHTHPFVADNATRLRRMAWLTLSLGLTISLSQLVLASQVTGYITAREISFHADIDWKTLLIGLGLFIIAEVFRIGVAMKEEQDLTI
jgi:Protein of unknown function (DUF2975)